MDQELKEMLTMIITRLDRIETRLDAIEQRMDALEQRMDALEQRMDALEQRMDALEQRMDAMEKRMDAMEKRMDAIEQRMDSMEKKQDDMRQRQNSMEGKLNGIDGRLCQFMAETDQNFRNVYARIDNLSAKMEEEFFGVGEVLKQLELAAQNQIDLVRGELGTYDPSNREPRWEERTTPTVLEASASYLTDATFGLDQNTLSKVLEIVSQMKPMLQKMHSINSRLLMLPTSLLQCTASSPSAILEIEICIAEIEQMKKPLDQCTYYSSLDFKDLCHLAKKEGLAAVEERKTVFLQQAQQLLPPAEALERKCIVLYNSLNDSPHWRTLP